jgi:hypothetical protein
MNACFGPRGARNGCLLSACAVLVWLGGCNSTGVGNPAPAASLTLAIVNDTEGDYSSTAAGASDAEGGAPDSAAGGASTDAAGSDATGGDATSEAGSAGEAGANNTSTNTSTATGTESLSLPLHSIQEAIVVLGKLRFMPCDTVQGEVFTVPGPFVVDLKRKTTTPEIPPVPATVGGYCGIDAPLAPAEAPASLAGRSLFFDGFRADGTFFIVYANMIGTLRLRAKPGTAWQGMAEPPLFFWALRPRRWLAPSELDGADVMPYGDHLRAVVIDADRHAALFLAIRSRLAGLSKLYIDVDGDGIFDDPDRAAVVGEGLDDAD